MYSRTCIWPSSHIQLHAVRRSTTKQQTKGFPCQQAAPFVFSSRSFFGSASGVRCCRHLKRLCNNRTVKMEQNTNTTMVNLQGVRWEGPRLGPGERVGSDTYLAIDIIRVRESCSKVVYSKCKMIHSKSPGRLPVATSPTVYLHLHPC